MVALNMVLTETEEDADYHVKGIWGTIAEQRDETFYDDRPDADDDMEKGRIKFPERKLYGRHNELRQLHSMYKGVIESGDENELSGKSSRIVLLPGYSGIGKSSLAREFSHELSRKGIKEGLSSRAIPHLFLDGKFTQLLSANPLSAITEAMGKLVSHLNQMGNDLILPETKNALLARLKSIDGEERKILLVAFPVLAGILGFENQNREDMIISNINYVKDAFLKFMRALCSGFLPVIMFIDDCQWADEASLEILDDLLSDKSLKKFLFIGAYRSNEVDENHSFRKKVDKIKGTRDDAVVTLEVFNLKPADIGSFIADALGKEAEDVLPITEVIYRKTMGNIFYTMQAIEELVRRNALYYDVMCFEWRWNTSSVELENFLSSDVVETVRSKISAMPEALQKILVAMAYTSNTIDIRTLGSLASAVLEEAENKSSDLERCIARAVVEGLLMKHVDEHKYSFAHDRIQEAAITMKSPGEKRDQFLSRIAKVLLDCGKESGEEWLFFVAVDHLNSLSLEYTEPINLSELNLKVAKLALRKAAHAKAVEMLREGVKHHGGMNSSWNDYAFSLDLFNNLLKTEFTLGNYEKAREAIEVVLKNAKSPSDKGTAQLIYLRCIAEFSSRDYAQGVKVGLEILKENNYEFPLTPKKSDIMKEEVLLKFSLRGRGLRLLEELPSTDENFQFELFFHVLKYALYIDNNDLVKMICSRAIRLAASNGISKRMPIIIASEGLNMRMCGKLKSACSYGAVSLKLANRFPQKDAAFARCTVILYGCLLNIYLPFKDSVQPLLDGYEVAIMHGSTEVAFACTMNYFFILFCIGLPMNSLIERQLLLYEDMSVKYGQPGFKAIFQMCRQYLLNLRGKSQNPTSMKGAAFDEDLTLKELEGNSRRMTLREISTFRLSLAYIFGDYAQMEEMIDCLIDYPLDDMSTSRTHLRLTYLGLASLTIGIKLKISKNLKLGLKIMKKFSELSKLGSTNARPVYLCMKAISTQKKSLFDEAIAACCDASLLQLEAIMNEQCALQLKSELTSDAFQQYICSSFWAYRDWGATTKAKQLEEQFKFLKIASRPRPSSVLKNVWKIPTS